MLYALGAASPLEIGRALSPSTSCFFLYESKDEHAQQLLPTLTAIGEARPLGLGDPLEHLSGDEIERVAGVVTFAEPMVSVAASIANRLNLPGHSIDAARNLTDKAAQRERLNAASVSPTSFAIVEESVGAAAAIVGVPAVLKPRRGSASRQVREITTLEDAEGFTGHAQEFILEALLPGGSHPADVRLGDYISIESAVVDGRVTHLSLTDKLPLSSQFRESGFVMPSTLPEEMRSACECLATEALAALGVRSGICHTEIKLAPSGPMIIEVNGRLGGSVNHLLTRASGYDCVALAITLALTGAAHETVAGALRLSRHVANVFVLPPVGASILRSAPTVRDLRSLPGVWWVRQHAEIGASLDSTAGSLSRIQTVSVEATDHEELMERIAFVRELTDQARYE